MRVGNVNEVSKGMRSFLLFQSGGSRRDRFPCDAWSEDLQGPPTMPARQRLFRANSAMPIPTAKRASQRP